jgi:hypothetical protein
MKKYTKQQDTDKINQISSKKKSMYTNEHFDENTSGRIFNY